MLSDQELQSLRNWGNLAEEAADEICALRAALAAQPAEPVAMLYDDGTWIAERTTAGRALNNRMLFAGSPKVGVYVAPPAQPADSTPSNKE